MQGFGKTLVVFFAFLASFGLLRSEGSTLPKEKRLEDLEDVIATLDKYYAFWWLQNVRVDPRSQRENQDENRSNGAHLDANQLKVKYEPLVIENEDSKRHYEILNQIVYELHDGHGGVTSPFAENDAVNAGFKIEEIQKKFYVTEVGGARGNHLIKVGAQLIAIDGVDVSTFQKNYELLGSGTERNWRATSAEILASVAVGKSREFTFLENSSQSKKVKILITKRTGVHYVRSVAGHSPELPIVVSKMLPPKDERVKNQRSSLQKIGYIRIHGFKSSEAAAQKVADALKKQISQKMTHLILDLRFSVGGSGEEAVEIANYFLSEKLELGQYCERKEAGCQVKKVEDLKLSHSWFSDPTKVIYKGPLTVLVGPLCRSSCELLAGFLKFSQRATLLGSTTAGAGGGYVCGPLATSKIFSGAEMCLSVQPFKVFGHFIEHSGIQPDIEVFRNLSDLTAGNDTAILKAREFLSGF